jgi:hypothetical protein
VDVIIDFLDWIFVDPQHMLMQPNQNGNATQMTSKTDGWIWNLCLTLFQLHLLFIHLLECPAIVECCCCCCCFAAAAASADGF